MIGVYRKVLFGKNVHDGNYETKFESNSSWNTFKFDASLEKNI